MKVDELAAGGLWSPPSDLARLLIEILHAWRGDANALLRKATAQAMLTPQQGGPFGLAGAVGGRLKAGMRPAKRAWLRRARRNGRIRSLDAKPHPD
ncbi:MAG: hypothetical protein ACHQAY_09905 [Hyphomicrobiales bacterium]